MINFDPKDPAYGWWVAWRAQIRNAKEHPERAEGYCRAAVIAQAQYEIYRAIRMVREYY